MASPATPGALMLVGGIGLVYWAVFSRTGLKGTDSPTASLAAYRGPVYDPATADPKEPKQLTQLTDSQIAQAAYNAGFRGQALVKAVAIALAESSGNATALNDRGEFSVGLWQINVNGYLAKRIQQFGLSSWRDLWDPNNNAKAAYRISNGGRSWRAWSVYNHGTYKRYVSRAIVAARLVTLSA